MEGNVKTVAKLAFDYTGTNNATFLCANFLIVNESGFWALKGK